MGSKKIAVVDLGTNTFHVLLARVAEEEAEIFYRERVAVMIGKGGITQGIINEEAQERALQALRHFRTIIDQENITEIHATATSAFRNAHNGMALVKRIKDETGIDIRVITGDEEAAYIYYGVKEALDIGPENVIVMDIGGGSVEFIICNQQHIYWKQSFEIGAQRLLDLFQPSDPILPEEITRLEEYFTEQLQPLALAVADYQPVTLIGSSGTFDTLSEMYQHRINQLAPPSDATELPLSYEGYFAIAREITSKNREERLKIPGMIEMRVDMIVVACALLSFVIKQFQLNDIRISAYALKEGVLYRTIRSLQKTMQNR